MVGSIYAFIIPVVTNGVELAVYMATYYDIRD